MSASKPKAFIWLLKREFWENRGAFLTLPLGIGGFIVFVTLAILTAAGTMIEEIDGERFMLTKAVTAIKEIPPEQLDALADLNLLGSSAIFHMVLLFVVFFYMLGALYDDRRDRSILFWKSLPLSDTQTVLSKVISALIVAPLIAVIAGIITMFGFMLVISIVALMHGGSPMTLIWGPASPLTLAAGHLAWIPVYALWALPTAGWLLLCSAWARSKPFLWAVMLPLFAGVIVSTTKVMPLIGLTTGWFWQNIVGRLLLGGVPGTDLVYRLSAEEGTRRDLESVVSLMSPASQLKSLAMPELWIGAAVGAVFIVLAIRLRKRAGEI